MEEPTPPNQVRLAVILLAVAFAIDMLPVFSALGKLPMAGIPLLAGLPVANLILILAIRRRREWARFLAFLVIAVQGGILLTTLIDAHPTSGVRNPLTSVTDPVSLALRLFAVVLLFGAAASEWFRPLRVGARETVRELGHASGVGGNSDGYVAGETKRRGLSWTVTIVNGFFIAMALAQLPTIGIGFVLDALAHIFGTKFDFQASFAEILLFVSVVVVAVVKWIKDSTTRRISLTTLAWAVAPAPFYLVLFLNSAPQCALPMPFSLFRCGAHDNQHAGALRSSPAARSPSVAPSAPIRIAEGEPDTESDPPTTGGVVMVLSESVKANSADYGGRLQLALACQQQGVSGLSSFLVTHPDQAVRRERVKDVVRNCFLMQGLPVPEFKPRNDISVSE